MSRQPVKRAWLIVLGIAGIAVGIVLALVRPFAPPPGPPEPGEIPREWFTPTPVLPPAVEPLDEAETPAKGEDTDREDVAPPLRSPLSVGYVQVGRIVYELDGKRVAEESYRLERPSENTVRLTSSGSFFVRVLFVTVTVTFDQEIDLDAELRPRAYTLEARGPLGFGNRRIAVGVEGGVVTATVGEERRELVLLEGNALFTGTLAAYVILPALYAARASDGALQLTAIGAGTGPGGRSQTGSTEEGVGELKRQGTAEIEVGGSVLVLEQYRAQTGSFGGTLLARGTEFVAFLGEGERPLTAYRVDLFPRGMPRTARR